MADQATNIISNAVLPYDPRRMKLLFGSVEYVAIEVLISAVVRNFMGKGAARSWTDLILVHTLSLPFMGGAVGFTDQDVRIDAKKEWTNHFKAGAKGIPAVLLAEWTLATFYKGFHVPWFGMKDLLITAGAKTISRPITAGLYQFFPSAMQDSYQLVTQMIANQKDKSSLKSKGG